MTKPPAWLPTGRDIEAIRAGVHWDAIRVRTPLGDAVLEHLGDRTGAVIEDTWGHALYWLVPAGTSTDWNVPESQALGVACWVTVPGPASDGGLRWRVPKTARGMLTGPRLLRAALEAAVRPREAAS